MLFRSVLILLIPVLAIGAVGNQQIFNAYMIWAPEHVSLVFFGQTMPTTWLVTLDAVVSVSALFGAVAFWRLWGKTRKEPNEVTKILMTVKVQSGEQLEQAAEDMEARAERIANVTYTHPNEDGSVAREAAPGAEPAQPMPKVGRNDPCPCGSGKKYKQCHGKLA